MKKISKFRPNNNNNFIYSLNYKFDSCSIAGKINGTALELIKRYNDFAKEAQSNGDYVNAEIFRQYAEHYRKIVTEINERKAARNLSENQPAADASAETAAETAPTEDNAPTPTAEAPVAPARSDAAPERPEAETAEAESGKRSFQVIEVNGDSAGEAAPVRKRIYRKRVAG